jgi:hypothetical protein
MVTVYAGSTGNLVVPLLAVTAIAGRLAMLTGQCETGFATMVEPV